MKRNILAYVSPTGSAKPANALSRRVAPYVWLAGALVIVLLAAGSWTRPEYRDPFHPVTPFDRTPISNPSLWYLLVAARGCIARGETLMAIAPTSQQSQEAYYLAIAILARNQARPAAYFGLEQSHHTGHTATTRYLVYFGMIPEERTGLRLTCEVPGFGNIYERTP